MEIRVLLFPLLLNALPSMAQSDTATVRVRYGSCDSRVSAVQLQAMHAHEATIVSKDGEQHVYRGPLLRTVLYAGCPASAGMDKRTLTAAAVKVTAADGYVALVAGMELDSTFQAKPVMLAWQRDGAALDAHQGAFQLIVPSDLRHSRNVRNVRLVEVLTP